MPPLVAPLPSGPLDLVADVHGEIGALLALLRRLGCDPERHRVERPLVFLGDLVDRGPDSPAVVELVMELVAAGVAQVIAGNHELNLLLDEHKEGNGWFWGDPSDGFYVHAGPGARRLPFPSRLATPEQRERYRRFFAGLPVALARPDLRVVHACWHQASLAALPPRDGLADLARTFEERLRAELDACGVRAAARAERAAWGELREVDRRPDCPLPNVAREDETEQMENPIKVITSGIEQAIPFDDLFFVGGKWRFVARARWWNEYRDETPVVIGHYWRRRQRPPTPEADDVLADVQPYNWCGARRNVLCIDYSVGRRHRERAQGRTRRFAGGLAALRWPERLLMFDDRPRPIATRGHGGDAAGRDR